ncbi:hypothetical protein Tco_0595035 [Tanacetum coccineum]
MMVQPIKEMGEDSDHLTHLLQYLIGSTIVHLPNPRRQILRSEDRRQRRVESSADQESLGVPEDASKQGRSIEDIDDDVDVSLVEVTQERQDDDLIFDTGILDDVGKNEQSTKKLDDSTAGEAVTTADDDSAVPTTNEEITLAQTLIQIKAAKTKIFTMMTT